MSEIPKTIEKGDCQYFVENSHWQCQEKDVKLYRCFMCGCYICMNHYIPVVEKCKLCLVKERGEKRKEFISRARETMTNRIRYEF